MNAQRVVVVLCGPAGSGKTTAARESGLKVYDRDDPEWASEKHFTMKLADLAKDPRARAVVIRAGASSSARAKAAELVNATHVYVLTEDPAECQRRVVQRGRADKVRGVASIPKWFEAFDRRDGVCDFPGWETALAEARPTGIRSREW